MQVLVVGDVVDRVGRLRGDKLTNRATVAARLRLLRIEPFLVLTSSCALDRDPFRVDKLLLVAVLVQCVVLAVHSCGLNQALAGLQGWLSRIRMVKGPLFVPI